MVVELLHKEIILETTTKVVPWEPELSPEIPSITPNQQTVKTVLHDRNPVLLLTVLSFQSLSRSMSP